MLESIQHMTIKLVENRNFGMKISKWCHILHNVIMNDITLRY